MDAAKIEKALEDSKQISFDVYEDLADKKSAFGKIAIDSLNSLSDNNYQEMYNKLLESHKFFSVGFQLYDDVKDFREDLQKGQFNWAVYKLKDIVDFAEFDNDIPTFNKLLYIRGVAQEVLKLSIDNFQKSLDIINQSQNESEWGQVVAEMKSTIESYLDITNGYIHTIKAKIEIANNKFVNDCFFDITKCSNTIVSRGLEYIKNDYLHSYADLKHIMYLSNLDDFDNTNQIHISDTFQRALLNDCLLAVSETSKVDISDYIDQEVDYLMNRRNNDVVGGWSYFPTVMEIIILPQNRTAV